ncbi:MAG: tRNA (guanosine(37)-N1)-methyltransferase TrmD [Spirochaetaceae bacterium]|nr:MAG: tRNA (guanosine(37)-N1)-methyltransferase TrmD [Spirochaetaceae bacterium]
MNCTVLTLFPEIIEGYVRSSIMAKAIDRGVVTVDAVNIRDYALDKHRSCDDAPYGGGAGMVMMPGPIAAALDAVESSGARTIYVSPSGSPFTQAKARELAREERLVILCGRYEGVDQRIIDSHVDEEISVGDYVLSSGEVAALVLIDAVYRLVDGVISGDSLIEESHEDGLLEYPHYTRPEVFQGRGVPDVLLSGHHARIREWRMQKQIEKTARMRPDLYEQYMQKQKE